MTRLSKILYITMVIVAITVIASKLITKDYNGAANEFSLLCWVGVAFMYELKCVKLQKQIDESNGNN